MVSWMSLYEWPWLGGNSFTIGGKISWGCRFEWRSSWSILRFTHIEGSVQFTFSSSPWQRTHWGWESNATTQANPHDVHDVQTSLMAAVCHVYICRFKLHNIFELELHWNYSVRASSVPHGSYRLQVFLGFLWHSLLLSIWWFVWPSSFLFVLIKNWLDLVCLQSFFSPPFSHSWRRGYTDGALLSSWDLGPWV